MQHYHVVPPPRHRREHVTHFRSFELRKILELGAWLTHVRASLPNTDRQRVLTSTHRTWRGSFQHRQRPWSFGLHGQCDRKSHVGICSKTFNQNLVTHNLVHARESLFLCPHLEDRQVQIREGEMAIPPSSLLMAVQSASTHRVDTGT